MAAGGFGLAWTHVSSSLWQVSLPAGTPDFEFLFYNGERRLRSRLASSTGLGYYMNGGVCYSTATGQPAAMSSCNLGTFFRIAAAIPPTGANATCPSVTNSSDASESKCLDRFAYDPRDPIAQWINLNAGVPEWDLYVVYEGSNPDTSQPIIKAFLNPLVGWIWAGLVILVFGTFVALVPPVSPSTAALRVPATRAAPSEPALKGGD